MIEDVRESAIKAELVEPHVLEKGIRDLHRTTESDGYSVTLSSRPWA
jgi:hypothetical protein